MVKNDSTIKEGSLKEHPTTYIHLYEGGPDRRTKKVEWYEDNRIRGRVWYDLKAFVENNDFPTCPNCGGLLPDLVITDREKLYSFTCTKIEDNSDCGFKSIAGKRKDPKLLKETDYVTLAGWVMAQHFDKNCLDGSLRDFLKKLLKENIEKFKADEERLPNLKRTLETVA